MLPPSLARLQKELRDKGVLKRSGFEDALLADVELIERTFDDLKRKDEDLVEGVERYTKRANAGQLMGPTPGTCPMCGRGW